VKARAVESLAIGEDDLFEMANVHPRTTGLHFVSGFPAIQLLGIIVRAVKSGWETNFTGLAWMLLWNGSRYLRLGLTRKLLPS